ncbi:hypothetical protein [Candidatus Protochlamydia amoebophila]|uniref:Uncharacterized protein n=1 Tax=Protochlamydia amoebophila (strain UWE25) TaxID=264201 RepID=Q6MC63_PARUW|nr:hypothetical protein [Candidatus Protochlamydia amoebophila]CAF23836.1 unnamed protein product [Candidatus Protochlamydia amoebophila UWE25]
MTIKVESITRTTEVGQGTNLPSQYQHLITLSPALINEMGKKSIDILFLDFGMAEGQLRLQNKRLSYQLRLIEKDRQTEKVEKKLAEYDRSAPIVTAAFAGVAAIAGAFAGGAGAQIGQGISQTISTTREHLDNKSRGRVEHHDHQYQTVGALIQDHSQELQRENQEFDRALSTADRAHQASQRVIEQLANAA